MGTVTVTATLNETLELRPKEILRAILTVLQAEINARRANEAALIADLLRQVNELRAVVVPTLPALTVADLAAKAPPPLTAAQLLVAIKVQL